MKETTLTGAHRDNNAPEELSEAVKTKSSRSRTGKGRNATVKSVEKTEMDTMTIAKGDTAKVLKGNKALKVLDDMKDVPVKSRRVKRGKGGAAEDELRVLSGPTKDDSPKKTIMEAVKIAVGKLGKSDFYEGDSIPAKKLKNAIEVMGVGPDETVYALIDSTLFGSGKCGLVVTSFGIRWKNDWANDTVDTCYSWNELREKASRMKATEFTLEFSKDSCVGIAGSGIESKELKKVLNHILKLAF